MGFFQPDRYFSSAAHIDINRDLLGRGYTHVLLDIDNTVVSRATHDVPRDIAAWIARSRDAGVQFCFLSNNWHSSVIDFARSVDLPIVSRALKPLPHGYMLAMRKLHANRKNTVVVGDQLLTDVVGAHATGCAAYLVVPLVTQDLPHTLALRNIERALIGARRPEPAVCGRCDGDAAPGVQTDCRQIARHAPAAPHLPDKHVQPPAPDALNLRKYEGYVKIG